MKRSTILLLLGIMVVVVGLLTWMVLPQGTVVYEDNVFMEGDTQVVVIRAKGGYLPRFSQAQAGVATVLRVETDNTYDCSLSLLVPAVNYQGQLPSTGVTDIALPPQTAGTRVDGLCTMMGMYRFAVDFQ